MSETNRHTCMINLASSYVFVDTSVKKEKRGQLPGTSSEDRKTERLSVYDALADMMTRLRLGWRVELAGAQSVALGKDGGTARYRFWGGYPIAIGLLRAAKAVASVVFDERALRATEREAREQETLVFELHTDQFVFEIGWTDLVAFALAVASGRITTENIITWQDAITFVGTSDTRVMFLPTE